MPKNTKTKKTGHIEDFDGIDEDAYLPIINDPSDLEMPVKVDYDPDTDVGGASRPALLAIAMAKKIPGPNPVSIHEIPDIPNDLLKQSAQGYLTLAQVQRFITPYLSAFYLATQYPRKILSILRKTQAVPSTDIDFIPDIDDALDLVDRALKNKQGTIMLLKEQNAKLRIKLEKSRQATKLAQEAASAAKRQLKSIQMKK